MDIQILSASYIIKCNDSFEIIKNGAIVFNTNIIDIDEFKIIKKKYPHSKITYLGSNSVIMPGFINPHVHLEFSQNSFSLEYGSFIKWLYSVIQNRDTLLQNLSTQFLIDILNNMIKHGTTTIGAISSFNLDMQACIDTPLNVVYFNEILGSNPNMIDMLWEDFTQKTKQAINNKSNNFIPAIAIHSPYSTHPLLIREALKLAKKENMAIQTHFLESYTEYQWLQYNKGDFKHFFQDFLKQTKPITNIEKFLSQFENTKHLSFTHCVYAKNYISDLKKLNINILHCPNSNRLLVNNTINLDDYTHFNIAIATDGLSSNYSINLIDELRSALFIHKQYEPNTLAKQLLMMATINGAKALNLNKGSLEIGKDADMICFNLKHINNPDTLPLNIILNFNTAKYTIINGQII